MAINGPASPYRARDAFLGHIARSRDHGVSHGALPTRNPPKAIVASYGLSPTQVKQRFFFQRLRFRAERGTVCEPGSTLPVAYTLCEDRTRLPHERRSQWPFDTCTSRRCSLHGRPLDRSTLMLVLVLEPL
jgi:hypothetical protein